MNKGKNLFLKRLVIVVIVLSFCLSALQLSAQNITNENTEPKKITITKADMQLEKQSIRTIAEKQSFEQFSQDTDFSLAANDEVLVTADYSGHTAVVDNGAGNAVFFAELQDPDDFLTREIAAVPSFDGGATWDYDTGGVFPNDGGYNELPSLDFQSGMTAYGTWISADFPGMTCMSRLEDISDPAAGEGWVYWNPDWVSNGLNCGPMYSTDIGCYDGPLNEEPGVFWGIAAWTGDMDDDEYGTFDNGMFMNYFSGEYIYVSWLTELEGCYSIQIDIDQSNGMIYWAYEVYNPETGVNDLWLMYQTMEGWFADESFPIWQITGPAADPAIMAENGILNVVFESEGDIICLYSDDNAENLEFSIVAESEDAEMYPDIAGTGSFATCGFYKEGDVYVATSNDGGVNWNVKGTKLNDVSGTLADEYHCINLLPSRVFWTDTRNGVEDVYSDTAFTAPNTPTITGPNSGKPNQAYDFTVTATHPDGDNVYYYVDWGDGSNTGWDGPHASGSGETFTHTYTTEEGFTIRAKAKSEEGAESGWAEYSFSTPRNKITFLQILLEKFPFLQVFLGFL
jgi:hypothetical protein